MILDGASKAFEGGWNKVKLYFMLGLPGETEEDMKEIPRLADRVARKYYEIPKDQRNGKCQITFSTSFFIPKPFTPFQWAEMFTQEDYIHRAHVVNQEMKEQLNRKSLKYNWHEADVTVLPVVTAGPAKYFWKRTVWDVSMIPGAMSLTMKNGCRRLKTPEWIWNSIRCANGIWTSCSRGISLMWASANHS